MLKAEKLRRWKYHTNEKVCIFQVHQSTEGYILLGVSLIPTPCEGWL